MRIHDPKTFDGRNLVALNAQGKIDTANLDVAATPMQYDMRPISAHAASTLQTTLLGHTSNKDIHVAIGDKQRFNDSADIVLDYEEKESTIVTTDYETDDYYNVNIFVLDRKYTDKVTRLRKFITKGAKQGDGSREKWCHIFAYDPEANKLVKWLGVSNEALGHGGSKTTEFTFNELDLSDIDSNLQIAICHYVSQTDFSKEDFSNATWSQVPLRTKPVEDGDKSIAINKVKGDPVGTIVQRLIPCEFVTVDRVTTLEDRISNVNARATEAKHAINDLDFQVDSLALITDSTLDEVYEHEDRISALEDQVFDDLIPLVDHVESYEDELLPTSAKGHTIKIKRGEIYSLPSNVKIKTLALFPTTGAKGWEDGPIHLYVNGIQSVDVQTLDRSTGHHQELPLDEPVIWHFENLVIDENDEREYDEITFTQGEVDIAGKNGNFGAQAYGACKFDTSIEDGVSLFQDWNTNRTIGVPAWSALVEGEFNTHKNDEVMHLSDEEHADLSDVIRDYKAGVFSVTTTDSVTENSEALVTSGGVYSFVKDEIANIDFPEGISEERVNEIVESKNYATQESLETAKSELNGEIGTINEKLDDLWPLCDEINESGSDLDKPATAQAVRQFVLANLSLTEVQAIMNVLYTHANNYNGPVPDPITLPTGLVHVTREQLEDIKNLKNAAEVIINESVETSDTTLSAATSFAKAVIFNKDTLAGITKVNRVDIPIPDIADKTGITTYLQIGIVNVENQTVPQFTDKLPEPVISTEAVRITRNTTASFTFDQEIDLTSLDENESLAIFFIKDKDDPVTNPNTAGVSNKCHEVAAYMQQEEGDCIVHYIGAWLRDKWQYKANLISSSIKLDNIIDRINERITALEESSGPGSIDEEQVRGIVEEVLSGYVPELPENVVTDDKLNEAISDFITNEESDNKLTDIKDTIYGVSRLLHEASFENGDAGSLCAFNLQPCVNHVPKIVKSFTLHDVQNSATLEQPLVAECNGVRSNEIYSWNEGDDIEFVFETPIDTTGLNNLQIIWQPNATGTDENKVPKVKYDNNTEVSWYNGCGAGISSPWNNTPYKKKAPNISFRWDGLEDKISEVDDLLSSTYDDVSEIDGRVIALESNKANASELNNHIGDNDLHWSTGEKSELYFDIEELKQIVQDLQEQVRTLQQELNTLKANPQE